MDRNQIKELLLQALETEIGGVQVYTTALDCVVNEDLRDEWEQYLDETERHVEIVRGLCETFGIDETEDTPGRMVVRHIGESLVQAMHMALDADEPEAAELVATECVTLAETKDHHNWGLLGELAKELKGAEAKALRQAHEEVEEEEDEHLYHTRGWSRELWLDSLGLPAQLPPPEEERDVKTAIGAARAAASRSPAHRR